ncbi:MAG: hypothetical protein U0470_03065 [Anaerolineae bacterium]
MEPVRRVPRRDGRRGAVYVKAGTPSQPLFVDEAAFTAALAERWPERLPRCAGRPTRLRLAAHGGRGPPVRERADLTAPQRRELALVGRAPTLGPGGQRPGGGRAAGGGVRRPAAERARRPRLGRCSTTR